MKSHAWLIAAGLLLAAVSILSAHPPDSLLLELDSAATALRVKAFHPVKNPANHFVVTIEVKVNGAQTVIQTYRVQGDRDRQPAVYELVGLEPGDKIEVTAVCNKSGKRKAGLTVPVK
jgi:hypothetical protein